MSDDASMLPGHPQPACLPLAQCRGPWRRPWV